MGSGQSRQVQTALKQQVDNSTSQWDTSSALNKVSESNATSGSKEATQGIIEFKLRNVHKFHEWAIDERILSEPSVIIRGIPWRILMIHRKIGDNGTKIPSVDDLIDPPISPNELMKHWLAVFLQCNAENPSSKWACRGRAEFYAVRKNGASQTLVSCAKNGDVRDIDHVFTSRENDWGFNDFISMGQMLSASLKLLDDEDSIHLRVYVLADQPYGLNEHSKVDYVGLKNQGATCYLNSLLQTLFFTNELRRAVYNIPLENHVSSASSSPCSRSSTSSGKETSGGSVSFALQRVFYELQHSKEAVDTQKLTRSFGWKTVDCFMQHDAQELCRVLLESLEKHMQQCGNSSISDTIRRLYCGKMLSYIRCKNVPIKSHTTEEFYDIQLKVKGNRSVYEAFREYIQVESLDGENRYDAGVSGLQDAEKGVIFLSFPPVLYLHLMRFEYDSHTNSNVKINDRFEFPLQLELKEFLKDPTSDSKYFLHAVLVHSGDHRGGHYVAYIDPHGDGHWYKFNDEIVTAVTLSEAVEMNYGGNSQTSTSPLLKKSGRSETNKTRDTVASGENREATLAEQEEEIWARLSGRGYRRGTDYISYTNAYMLVYLQLSAKDKILAAIKEKDIPQPLRQTFEGEKQRKLANELSLEKSQLYMWLSLYTENNVATVSCRGYGIFDTKPEHRLRIRKDISARALISQVVDIMKVPSSWIRLWYFHKDASQCRSYLHVLGDENQYYIDGGVQSVENIWCQAATDLNFISPSPSLFASSNDEGSHLNDVILLFIKAFRFAPTSSSTISIKPEEQPMPGGELIYMGHLMAMLEHKLGDLLKPFLDKCEVSISSPSLRLYFESDSVDTELLKLPSAWYTETQKSPTLGTMEWSHRRLASALRECRLTLPRSHGHVIVMALDLPSAARRADGMISSFYQTSRQRRFVLFQLYPLSSVNIWTETLRKESDPPVQENSKELLLVDNLSNATIDHTVKLTQFWKELESVSKMHVTPKHWCPLLVLPDNLQYCNIIVILQSLLVESGITSDLRTISPSSKGKRSLKEYIQLYQRLHQSDSVKTESISKLTPVPSSYPHSLRDLLRSTSRVTLNVNREDKTSSTTYRTTQCIPSSNDSAHSNKRGASVAVITCSRQYVAYRIFYRIHSLPISQLELQSPCRVFFLPYDHLNQPNAPYDISLKVSSIFTVKDLVESVCSYINYKGFLNSKPPGRSNKANKGAGRLITPSVVRLWEVYSLTQLTKEYLDYSDTLPSYNVNTFSLRVDEIHPDDRLVIESDNRNLKCATLRVYHYDGDISNLHGIPFTIIVKDGDSYRIIVDLIRQRLCVPPSEFNQWELNIITGGDRVTPIRVDADEHIDIMSVQEANRSYHPPWIGLNHPNYQSRGVSKAIKFNEM